MQLESGLNDLEIISSSNLAVRLRASDRNVPIVISIERSDIDDYFRLDSSTKEKRRDIVEVNLRAFADISRDRFEHNIYSIGHLDGMQLIQIVLTFSDLRG